MAIEPIDGEPVSEAEASLYDQVLALVSAAAPVGGDDDVLADGARQRARAAVRARRKDLPRK